MILNQTEIAIHFHKYQNCPWLPDVVRADLPEIVAIWEIEKWEKK